MGKEVAGIRQYGWPERMIQAYLADTVSYQERLKSLEKARDLWQGAHQREATFENKRTMLKIPIDPSEARKIQWTLRKSSWQGTKWTPIGDAGGLVKTCTFKRAPVPTKCKSILNNLVSLFAARTAEYYRTKKGLSFILGHGERQLDAIFLPVFATVAGEEGPPFFVVRGPRQSRVWRTFGTNSAGAKFSIELELHKASIPRTSLPVKVVECWKDAHKRLSATEPKIHRRHHGIYVLLVPAYICANSRAKAVAKIGKFMKGEKWKELGDSLVPRPDWMACWKMSEAEAAHHGKEEKGAYWGCPMVLALASVDRALQRWSFKGQP